MFHWKYTTTLSHVSNEWMWCRCLGYKQSPPLDVSAIGHKDSPPGCPTHLHSHPHPLWLRRLQASWRPERKGPARCHCWTCSRRWPPASPPHLEPLSPPPPTTCPACNLTIRFLVLGRNKWWDASIPSCPPAGWTGQKSILFLHDQAADEMLREEGLQTLTTLY